MLIDHDAALQDACQHWAHARWLALDTEFVREQTYYPKLCLIQVSDGGAPAVVDMLSIRDATPLLTLIERRDITKVFHSPSQDLEIFVQLHGKVPQPLFDTQMAAALLGEGDQLGYATLVQRRLGVTLDKSLTRTDWARRPLKPAEIDYAAGDVRHLAVLYPLLEAELQARDRLEWLHEECARMLDPAQYLTEPEDAWQRLRGLVRLSPAARPVAAALAAWRERQAMASDRPRKWILADDTLYRLAEARPATPEALQALAIMPPKVLARHSRALLEAIASTPAHDPLQTMADPMNEAQKTQLKRARVQLEASAERLGVPPALLATRSELEQLVRGDACTETVRLFGGWRRRAATELAPLLPPQGDTIPPREPAP